MTDVATREEPPSTYPREDVERLITYRLLGGLAALLCVLAVLAPAKATVYQLAAFGPAAGWLLWRGSARFPASLPDTKAQSTHPAVLGTYAVSALVAGLFSFGTWHSTPETEFSGFDRGAGWYTLVFAVLLGLATGSLGRSSLMRPFGSALHAVALACGTVFIGAALSGTYSRGISPLRSGVLASGVLTLVVAARMLKRRSGDQLSRQGQAAAVFSAGGALMAASSFMSWGAGGFIVNYRPGASMGGFDGRITLWSGAAIVALWVGHFLFGRHDEQRWLNSVRATAALGFAGLMAVVASSSGSSHPARALAAAACVLVLVKAAGSGQLPGAEREPAGGSAQIKLLVGRVFVGAVAAIGASLVGVGFCSPHVAQPGSARGRDRLRRTHGCADIWWTRHRPAERRLRVRFAVGHWPQLGCSCAGRTGVGAGADPTRWYWCPRTVLGRLLHWCGSTWRQRKQMD